MIYRQSAPNGNTYAMHAADHGGGESLFSLPRIAVNELVVAPDGVTLLGRVSASRARNQDIMW